MGLLGLVEGNRTRLLRRHLVLPWFGVESKIWPGSLVMCSFSRGTPQRLHISIYPPHADMNPSGNAISRGFEVFGLFWDVNISYLKDVSVQSEHLPT